jgi:hypothetical protein
MPLDPMTAQAILAPGGYGTRFPPGPFSAPTAASYSLTPTAPGSTESMGIGPAVLDLSARQMEIDDRWRAPREAAETRVAGRDPMAEEIKAEQQKLDLERLQPVGSESSIAFDPDGDSGPTPMLMGKQEMDWKGSRPGHAPMGGITIGEQVNTAKARVAGMSDPRVLTQQVMSRAMGPFLAKLEATAPAQRAAAMREFLTKAEAAGLDAQALADAFATAGVLPQVGGGIEAAPQSSGIER